MFSAILPFLPFVLIACRDFLDEEDQNETEQNMAVRTLGVDTEIPKDENLYTTRINCHKCVWEYTRCPGPTKQGMCPTGHKYKRDPPDGGYYG